MCRWSLSTVTRRSKLSIFTNLSLFICECRNGEVKTFFSCEFNNGKDRFVRSDRGYAKR